MAFDQLVGPGRWRPRHHPSLFVIRFPSTDDPGDTGRHIDGSFDVGGEWWVNLHSRGRALLMLFLFTDVGPDDAPPASGSVHTWTFLRSWSQWVTPEHILTASYR
jgi:hypothetical protein